MSSFTLHERLAADCTALGSLPLCQILPLNDKRYPWFILVPQRAEIREIYQLSADDQLQFWTESTHFGQAIMQRFDGDKLNIGALGNMVPQLHVHHIIRRKDDPAWPGAVWGGPGEAQPYRGSEIEEMISMISALGLKGYKPIDG